MQKWGLLQDEEEMKSSNATCQLRVSWTFVTLLFFVFRFYIADRPPGAKLLLLRYKPIHFFYIHFLNG